MAKNFAEKNVMSNVKICVIQDGWPARHWPAGWLACQTNTTDGRDPCVVHMDQIGMSSLTTYAV